MHDMTKTRMILTAMVAMTLLAAFTAQRAQASSAAALTMEYLDPFDLSVTAYRVSAQPQRVGGSSAPTGAVSAVTAMEPYLSTSSISSTGASYDIASPIQVVTVADAASLSDGLIEMSASTMGAATIRIRAMVRIPFMPALRSPCAPLV